MATLPVLPLAVGLAPSDTQGGWTDAEQIVFGTLVNVVLSGLVWKAITAFSVPVVEYVTRHATQGTPVEEFDCDGEFPPAVNVNVYEQSGNCWACTLGMWRCCWRTSRKANTAASSAMTKGRALRIVVMP